MDFVILDIKNITHWVATWGLLVFPLCMCLAFFFSRRLGVQIGTVSILLSPLFYIPSILTIFGNYHWVIRILLGLLTAVIMIILNAIQDAESESLQRVRDNRALEVKNEYINMLNENGKAAFSLYLRPFFSTNILMTQVNDNKTQGGNLNLDLESLIEKIMKNDAPLVALGKPGEMTGAGRILTTEADWRNEVTVLIKNARTIFVLPSEHLGTLFEIQIIKNSGLLPNCIWIMPESIGEMGTHVSIATGIPRFLSETKYSDFSKTWEETAIALEKIGIALPTYDYGGMLFKLNETGEMIDSRRLSLSKKFNKMGSLRTAIKKMNSNPERTLSN